MMNSLLLQNPPYVRQEAIKELKPVLKSGGYECFTGTADLYVYFFERGVKLLRGAGILAYISSNSFLNSGFGEKLRRYLTEKTRIRLLIDFAETKVFEAVTEPCVICLTRDSVPGHAVKFLKWDQSTPPERIREIFDTRSQSIQQRELKPESWQLESPAVLRLLEKLRRAGKTLGEYVGGRFYYGIKTGLNEAFVVDRATRDGLVREHKSSAEILKPYLRGRDVRRWHTVDPDLWLIFTRHGIDIEEYPAILEHLTPFKKSLMPGVAGGRKPGSYKWYEIQDNIAYWSEFEQPKLIYQEINRTTAFAWDEHGFLLGEKRD